MRIEEAVVVRAPQDEVWALIADPDAMRRVWRAVVRWEAAGERTQGEGARFDLLMRVASANIGGLVEVVEWDPPCELAWTSVTGIDHRVRWRLRATRDGGTRVSLRLAYNSPGGLLAAVADQLASPVVREAMRGALARLAAEVEGRDPVPPTQDPVLAPLRLARSAVLAAEETVHAAGTFASAGLVRPMRPDAALRAALAVQRWGVTPAAGIAVNAARFGGAPMLVDEDGTLSFREVDELTSRLAAAWAAEGLEAGRGLGVMCRNHRGFVLAVGAASKLGADALLLNTAFAGPQLAEVVAREDPAALCFDAEFAELLRDAAGGRPTYVAEDLAELAASAPASPPPAPPAAGRVTILTSGTTGTPKGASRSAPSGAGPLVTLLSKIPLRARETTLIAAPLFHAWGFAHLGIALPMGSTVVLQRRFDPERTLAAIEEHRVSVCPMVPVMLQRILALPEEVRARYDTSSLRVVPVSGSALSGDLACRFMDAFGDVLYNLYGSTEVAWATIATPRDLRRAPGTAGRPPRGTTLRVVDDAGKEVPIGTTGRIVVGNDMLFEGYTGGGTKAVVDGLMATGDVGHLDHAGRLFVEGRDDDMIVSGGENVFPQEVEEVIARHEAVADAACVGVDDEDFGQRLRAYVVLADGAQASEDDIKAHVRERLARFKVPREVEFVDELPRTSTGKVLRRQLGADAPR